jgi:hypothetical protein
MKHSKETKEKISISLKEFHASGLKALKKTIRKLSKGVYTVIEKEPSPDELIEQAIEKYEKGMSEEQRKNREILDEYRRIRRL